ncbi:type II RES/Xre toxin-antitoxin system antitoxin [Notoacmeibacter ruber]|uniref:DUF2384 domain-containing protein n=1 Tax=Notoacmeibacter ruber TaxID=2670375 RepID=A0A3L7J3T5_9HYPH|nr:antitoxin Xre/MbcA/ParS toxin-binding domain-containing protein [Notoacmeibacter ruber]RLQ85316.1 DUF2384 domain-containing protein [Notoacmeibacter ruber]
MSVLERVTETLGGQSVLGRPLRSQADLAIAVLGRLPLESLTGISRAGFSEREIDVLVIPARTRRHRAAKAERLTVEESDRAVRLARVQAQAIETFGDEARASAWLRRPLRQLSDKAPLTLVRTETGARLVETLLAKLAYGAAA